MVGLGNPGSEYEDSPHNAGFMVVDALAEAWDFPAFRRPWRWRARVSEGSFGGEPVQLVKPQTYMNRSGGALTRLLTEEFHPSRDLLVVVDEVALPLGSVRLRRAGSAGGHNGLKSIAGRLASEEYPRMRIGVGPVPDGQDQSDFLLTALAPEQLAVLQSQMSEYVRAVECWITDGIETAMNRFNRRGTQSD